MLVEALGSYFKPLWGHGQKHKSQHCTVCIGYDFWRSPLGLHMRPCACWHHSHNASSLSLRFFSSMSKVWSYPLTHQTQVQAMMQTWACMFFDSHQSRRIILHAKHIESMHGKSRKFLPHATHFGLFGN